MAYQENHVTVILKVLDEWKSLEGQSVELDGTSLTIAKLMAVSSKRVNDISMAVHLEEDLIKNVAYLDEKLTSGHVIYGVNTGFGGSANVRCSDPLEVQRSLIRHLNVGFGQTIDLDVVRGVMAVRANSLALGYSGVRPEVVKLLCGMINADVIPVTPLRGSISASGDLAPTSYIAACMSGRPESMVTYRGEEVLATEAFNDAKLPIIEFQAKEALAVVNSASFASTLAARVLFDASIAVLLTQLTTAMSVECLRGRMESFHPTIHKGLPHQGNQEVANNLVKLLEGSKLARTGLESTKEDNPDTLKQDRYPLRTSPQWLGPTTEILLASIRRVTIELNSSNDNPIIDHRRDEILHGGNFQGISTTIAMDQTRQALQLCGKLIFAQLSEILNYTMNDGLPPNLSGCDVNSDFGFKGVDTATASYASELDYLTNPLTNHVVSAEMHNQAVNSMALVSARMTGSALELLQMILTNALCAQCQAIDLRWLEGQVVGSFERLLIRCQLTEKMLDSEIPLPWYQLAFNLKGCSSKLESFLVTRGIHVNGILEEFSSEIDTLTGKMKAGQHVKEVSRCLGKGTREAYIYIRETLNVRFNHGPESDRLDKSLEKIFASIKNREIADLVTKVFQQD